jgi:SAM-dependent methyltransferase
VIYALGSILGYSARPLYQWPLQKNLKILESSPRGPYTVMLSDKVDYYPTEYSPAKIASGTDPRSYADFQNLRFDEGTFDLAIASDVFEHIRKDDVALAGLFRVLKPGGSLLLTVPYDHSRELTIQRVDTSGERDIHILEPEYHGGGGSTLTFRNYGRDFLSVIRKAGFSVAHIDTSLPELGVTPQSIILASKGDYVNFTMRAAEGWSGKALGFLLPYRIFLLFKYSLKGFFRYLWEIRHR